MIHEIISALTLYGPALSIISGEKQSNIASPVTGSSGPPSYYRELVPDPETECLEEVMHVIAYLHEFSMTIQNLAPPHRPQESSAIDVSRFEHFGIQHISNRFPGAEPYVVRRLGKSNARRRHVIMKKLRDSMIWSCRSQSQVIAERARVMTFSRARETRLLERDWRMGTAAITKSSVEKNQKPINCQDPLQCPTSSEKK